MSAARQDFVITAGTAKTIYFALTQGGSALDLTNVPLRWRLADAINNPVAVVEKLSTGSAPGITVSNPSGGLCQVAIEDTDITDYGLFWHLLQADLAGSGWTTMSEGRVVVGATIGPAA